MCGNENEYKSGDIGWSNNIEVDLDIDEDLDSITINSIDIYCQNDECPNYIELKLKK
jgi:hypothetical protein